MPKETIPAPETPEVGPNVITLTVDDFPELEGFAEGMTLTLNVLVDSVDDAGNFNLTVESIEKTEAPEKGQKLETAMAGEEEV